MKPERIIVVLMLCIYSFIAVNFAFMYGFNLFFADKFNFKMTFFYSFIFSSLLSVFNGYNHYAGKSLDLDDDKTFFGVFIFLFFRPIFAFAWFFFFSLFL